MVLKNNKKENPWACIRVDVPPPGYSFDFNRYNRSKQKKEDIKIIEEELEDASIFGSNQKGFRYVG